MLAFSPNQSLLAAGYDAHVLVWQTADGQLQHRFTPRTAAPVCQTLAFSPDSRLLACGTCDRTVYVWDVASGEWLQIFHGPEGAICSLAFAPVSPADTPSRRLLAAGCGDRQVYLWDVESGHLLHCLTGHLGWVLSVAFVGDGNILATGSHDGIVKLWDVKTGACLETLQPRGPYAGMNITGVTGISEAQKAALRALGAVEE